MAEIGVHRRIGVPSVRIGIQSLDRLRREVLTAYLETLPAFRVAGHVAHRGEALTLCALERPDVLIVDAGADSAKAIEDCGVLQHHVPGGRLVLMYNGEPGPDSPPVQRVASAAVPYSHGLGAVVAALREVSDGVLPASPADNGLSDRQRQILMLMAAGHTAVEIAHRLGISPGTVENHKRRAYAKLGAVSAVQAVVRAAALGLLDVPGPEPAGGGTTLDGPPHPALVPEPLPGEEPGRLPMMVALGRSGEDFDRVVRTLIAHGLPVLRDHGTGPRGHVQWLRWHRGPVVRVLVNPRPEHWRMAENLGRTVILVHDGPVNRECISLALYSGALAVVPVEHVEDRLISVVALVASGYLVMDSSANQPFISSALRNVAHRRATPPELTAREHDILRSIGRSHTVRQTARTLGIAEKTVENAQGHLFQKLGVHNRAQAVATAYLLGLLHPDSAGGA
ncbi:MAG TPA: LuxR C-terminal-related transcriptional regulator [Rugosimonospora sp.]|nr:LuxR C-terminal-related transcriptional regulator [Rugosimonospora sp.]